MTGWFLYDKPGGRPAWWLEDDPRRPRRPATVETKLRSAPDGTPVMFGHFAVYDRWTEIRSSIEGNFLERIRPGELRFFLSGGGPYLS
jgi:hypothetical protein